MLLPDKYNFNKQKLHYNKNSVKITAYSYDEDRYYL